MRNITFSQATLEAMEEEMQLNPLIFVMGEDIAHGGIFGQFKGLSGKFPGRVIDMPISETMIVGGAVGAALAGMHPVADLHFADFFTVCMDEIFNQMAKIRYMFGGQAKVPVVLRAPDGIINQAAAQHSQSVESFFLPIPGIKVVTPSNPADAKGLLKAALREENPVIYFENKVLYKESGPVPESEVLCEIGKAKVVVEGKDCTIVSYSIGMKSALGAASILEKEGIDCEVIDLMTISPWDKDTILNSVKKTHRLCICHEAIKQGGVGAEIAAVAAEEAFSSLDAPILRFGGPFVHIGFAPTLEKQCRVYPEQVAGGIRSMF
jgi:pyruvate/2-oxoglutarate/acetoin dehydrogenase E1 component